MDRRTFLQTTAAASAFALMSSKVLAEWKPRRPVNVVVPYKAGGGVDTFARAFSAGAADVLPVPVVIVNKPGSSGISGATAAASARPDGSTFLLTSGGSFVLNSMLREIDVDPFESFQTVAQIGNLKAGLYVPANSPYKTAADLVADAKANPGKLRWGHTGRGSFLHVAGQGFLNANGLDAGDVPFKGGAGVRAALIGNQVDFGVIGVNVGRGFENEMRALAIAASERDSIMSDVPTFAEQGLDYVDVSSPIVVFAPNGVDAEIVAGMEAALKDATASDKFAELMLAKGNAPDFLPGAEAEAKLAAMKMAVEPIVADLKANG